MTLSQAQATVDEWIRTVGIRYYGELTNTVILMEETGEVARLMARLYGEQSFKNPDDAAAAPAQLADEMAEHVLAHYPVCEISLTIRKFVLPGTQCVAVSLTRSRKGD